MYTSPSEKVATIELVGGLGWFCAIRICQIRRNIPEYIQCTVQYCRALLVLDYRRRNLESTVSTNAVVRVLHSAAVHNSRGWQGSRRCGESVWVGQGCPWLLRQSEEVPIRRFVCHSTDPILIRRLSTPAERCVPSCNLHLLSSSDAHIRSCSQGGPCSVFPASPSGRLVLHS